MSLNSQQTALFNQLLQGTLSASDVDNLVAWLGKEELDAEAAELIAAQLKQSVDKNQISPEVIAALELRLANILSTPKENKTRKVNFLRPSWLRYAAAIIIILGTVFFYRALQPSKQKVIAANPSAKTPAKADVQPGKEGAILTLADGSTVVLDSLGNGVIAKQNGSNLLLDNGKLIYHPDRAAAGDISYNTITTPVGRQFQLVLSDGTAVWLNAGSSLRFPAVFTGNERKVEMTGEVYFEVAKNANKPFRVKANDETEIKVLGTHFNINAYKDEASLSTTLLEGSVLISNGDQQTTLKPGQQAQVNGKQKASRIKVVNNINEQKIMAWKNGVFDFEDAKLDEIMRQVQRWYNVDVVYEKGIPQLEFIGKMGRDLTLSEVLRGLELSKVHFRLEGRRLVVLP